ncbi:MAG: VanZ family protein [Aeromicrobium sp.]|uniref:VanZ family protein n=1 Tax=Aeromicrobium sp. TaxID=1871063 RepID=UPI00261720D2|nr:VanZ family protein [Aeromicrobium sp.]MDF1703706.1 VanZ family protein [Aeromicrobium sp.]
MFREVPVLPVVIPLAVASLVAMLWHLRRRAMLTVPRAAVAVVLCVYVAGVVANTVFPVYLDKPGGPGHWAVYLLPFADYGLGDAVTNVVVFLPVGVLVTLLLPRASWWGIVGIATAFSLLIEGTQLVTARFLAGGHVADVNDLIFNVVGAVLGLGVYCGLVRISPIAAVVERFRWR